MDAAAFAEMVFGLSIFTGRLEQNLSQPPLKKFPLVLAIDLVEHVHHPAESIRDAAGIMEDGGILMIDTPNGNSGNI